MVKLTPTEKATQDATLANLHLVGIVDQRTDPELALDVGLAWRQNVGTAQARDGHGNVTRSVDFGFAGLSDVLIILPGGRFCAIEFKNANGQLRPAQRRFRDRVVRLGGVFILGRSVAFVLRELRLELIRSGHGHLIHEVPLTRLLQACA